MKKYVHAAEDTFHLKQTPKFEDWEDVFNFTPINDGFGTLAALKGDDLVVVDNYDPYFIIYKNGAKYADEILRLEDEEDADAFFEAHPDIVIDTSNEGPEDSNLWKLFRGWD